MRLIDADKLIKELKAEMKTCGPKTWEDAPNKEVYFALCQCMIVRLEETETAKPKKRKWRK